MDACAEGDVMAVLDLRSDDSLRDAGLAREVVNRVQKLRKKAGLQVSQAAASPLAFDSFILSHLGEVIRAGLPTACRSCARRPACRSAVTYHPFWRAGGGRVSPSSDGKVQQSRLRQAQCCMDSWASLLRGQQICPSGCKYDSRGGCCAIVLHPEHFPVWGIS